MIQIPCSLHGEYSRSKAKRGVDLVCAGEDLPRGAMLGKADLPILTRL